MKKIQNRAALWLWAFVFYFAIQSFSQGQSVLTDSQKIVAMTLLGEARGEGYAGMYAVACVIKQRATNRNLTPAQVCLQRKQFSCWNIKDPNRAKLPKLLETDAGYWAKVLAVNLSQLKSDHVKGADHYCARRSNPYWAKGKKPVCIIGNHKFYKLKK